MKSEDAIRIVVDRIEGDVAVLVLYEDGRVRFNLPVRFLPDGVRGGDHLRLAFTSDIESREAERAKIHGLLDELVVHIEQPQHAGFIRAHLVAKTHDVGEHDRRQLAGLYRYQLWRLLGDSTRS